MTENSQPPPRIHEDHITCPYCGRVDRNDWWMSDHGENMFELECGECGRTMKVIFCVSRTASTYPKEDACQKS